MQNVNFHSGVIKRCRKDTNEIMKPMQKPELLFNNKSEALKMFYKNLNKLKKMIPYSPGECYDSTESYNRATKNVAASPLFVKVFPCFLLSAFNLEIEGFEEIEEFQGIDKQQHDSLIKLLNGVRRIGQHISSNQSIIWAKNITRSSIDAAATCFIVLVGVNEAFNAGEFNIGGFKAFISEHDVKNQIELKPVPTSYFKKIKYSQGKGKISFNNEKYTIDAVDFDGPLIDIRCTRQSDKKIWKNLKPEITKVELTEHIKTLILEDNDHVVSLMKINSQGIDQLTEMTKDELLEKFQTLLYVNNTKTSFFERHLDFIVRKCFGLRKSDERDLYQDEEFGEFAIQITMLGYLISTNRQNSMWNRRITRSSIYAAATCFILYFGYLKAFNNHSLDIELFKSFVDLIVLKGTLSLDLMALSYCKEIRFDRRSKLVTFGKSNYTLQLTPEVLTLDDIFQKMPNHKQRNFSRQARPLQQEEITSLSTSSDSDSDYEGFGIRS